MPDVCSRLLFLTWEDWIQPAHIGKAADWLALRMTRDDAAPLEFFKG